jgi:hypothetical protein
MPEDALPENPDAVLRKYGKIRIRPILSAAVAALSVRAAFLRWYPDDRGVREHLIEFSREAES